MKRPGLIIVLALIITVGAYLRLDGLGRYTFWVDELYHVFAAKSLIAGNGALLPSGFEYDRSLFYTYLVAVSFKLFGVGETAARLPSAILGILMIGAAYLTARKLFDTTTGLIMAALVALSPYQIAWSQVCRMYPLFQLTYMFLFYSFYRAWETGRVGRFLPFAVLFAFSMHVHELTILFVPVAVVFFLLMSLIVLAQEGRHAGLRSRYVVAAAVSATVICAGCFLQRLLFPGYNPGEYFTVTPVWAMRQAHDVNYYRQILHATYPIFAALYPFALLVMALKKGRLAVYCACSFAVPFILLSTAFPWKDERYLYFAFPLFLLPAAFLIAQSIHMISGMLTGTGARMLRILAAAAAIPAIAYPALFPWVKITPGTFIKFTQYDFKRLAAFIDTIPAQEPLIVTQGVYIAYYCNRKADYQVRTNEFIQSGADKDTVRNMQGQKIDRESGVPIIDTVEILKTLESEHASAWFITDNSYMRSPSLSKDFQEHIKTNYRKMPVSDTMYYVYHYKGSGGIIQ